MPTGPRHGRRTPLPGRQRKVRYTPPWARRAEDRHHGLEDVTVRVIPTVESECLAAIADDMPERACVRCRWLSGVDDPDTRVFDFWVDQG